MSYLDSGFDAFFEKPLGLNNSQFSSIDQDVMLSPISANKIQDGVMSSSDNRTQLDLNSSLYTVSDGMVSRVQLGKFSDGEYGLRIFDRDGNVLIDITGENNLIQSPDGKLQLDLTRKQLRAYDENNLRALFGEL